jgi:hypothetical protein
MREQVAHAGAVAEAEAAATRATEAAMVKAQLKENQERQQQVANEESEAKRMIQGDMAFRTQQRMERQQARSKTRRSRGEEERDANINYLSTDTRVPPWLPICWHEKDLDTDWRWPFGLDWTWFLRGLRILNDERFVGLKLPKDFVKPSERMKLQQELSSARGTITQTV